MKFMMFPISIFPVMVIFVLKSPKFLIHSNDNSKNKKRKIDFSFDSTHCASHEVGSKLKAGPGGSTYPQLGQSQHFSPLKVTEMNFCSGSPLQAMKCCYCNNNVRVVDISVWLQVLDFVYFCISANSKLNFFKTSCEYALFRR